MALRSCLAGLFCLYTSSLVQPCFFMSRRKKRKKYRSMAFSAYFFNPCIAPGAYKRFFYRVFIRKNGLGCPFDGYGSNLGLVLFQKQTGQNGLARYRPFVFGFWGCHCGWVLFVCAGLYRDIVCQKQFLVQLFSNKCRIFDDRIYTLDSLA